MTNQHSRRGFTWRCYSKGFTLIELLVVVLIIGILAAVALPQYNKAVKKAQGREVLVALDALDKNLSAYYLEHDTYDGAGTETFSIDVPQLRHFRFLVGSWSAYTSGNAQFKNQNLEEGQPYERPGKRLYLRSPDDVLISAVWSKGKVHWDCSVERNSMTSCGDYFDCNTTPRMAEEFDAGGTIRTRIGGGACTLKSLF